MNPNLLDLFRRKRLLGPGGEEDYPTDYSEADAQTQGQNQEDPFGFIQNRPRPELEQYKSQLQRGLDYKKKHHSFGAKLVSALLPGYDIDKSPDDPKSDEFRQRVGLLAKLAGLEHGEREQDIGLARYSNTRTNMLRDDEATRQNRNLQEENRLRDDKRQAEQDRLRDLRDEENRAEALRREEHSDRRFNESQDRMDARDRRRQDDKKDKSPSISSQASADKQVLQEIQRDPKLQIFARFFNEKGEVYRVGELLEEFAKDPSLVAQYKNLQSLIANKKRKKLAGQNTYSSQGNQFPDLPIQELTEGSDNPDIPYNPTERR